MNSADSFGKKLAKQLDQVLLASIEGRFDQARAALRVAKELQPPSELSEELRREADCRLIEAELNILIHDKEKINAAFDQLIKILRSELFPTERKLAVAERSLISLGRHFE